MLDFDWSFNLLQLLLLFFLALSFGVVFNDSFGQNRYELLFREVGLNKVIRHIFSLPFH